MKKSQIVRGDIWNDKNVIAASERAEVRKYCVAYVTQANGRLFRSGDTLVCDASCKAVSSGETNPNFLLDLIKKGVAVYSCEALHAKCAVFDDYVLLGSANMSESSANRLVELSLLRKDNDLAMEVEAFIENAVQHSLNKLSEKEAMALCKMWNPHTVPWQRRLSKRKKELSCFDPSNHVVTIYATVGRIRSVSEEEIAESEKKASERLNIAGISTRGRSLSWYYTSEHWNERKPKAGDSLIVVQYGSRKKSARAVVYGPAPVVFVDKREKVRIVHYLSPDEGIPYGVFRNAFGGKKSMNRNCMPDDKFEPMVTFIKREKRNRR